MIYVFAGEGFEELEALTAVDLLRRMEQEVRLVGVGSRTVTGANGISVVCDLTEDEITADGLEMIVLPGGMPGTLNLERSAVVQQYIEYAAENDLWIGAICAAPSILGHKGLLKGKKATCFPGFEGELEGAEFTAAEVEQDGKLITGDGPGSAMKFALRLVGCLLGEEQAAALGEAL